MQTTAAVRKSVAAALLVGAAVVAAPVGPSAASRAPRVRTISISYRADDGKLSDATVLLPSSYGRGAALPLVISPHGRGLDGAANARLWGDLPAGGGFVVVNPDGMGSRLSGRFSWGAPGQIADLARMPAILHRALPWLRTDPRRIYAVGGSMGGQEALLLVALHPRLLAGAVAVDPVADFPRQYRNFGLRQGGHGLQRLVRDEVGGSPTASPDAFAARSPLSYAREIARSGLPLQIWWTRTDRVVLQSRLQSGLLVRRLRELGTRGPLSVVVGTWRHTAVLRADRELPTMLGRLGLLASLTRCAAASAIPAPSSRGRPRGARFSPARARSCSTTG